MTDGNQVPRADRPSQADALGDAERVPGAFFEALYRRDPDPWQFATSTYEQRRYELTLAHLPRLHYTRAFEPACSIGALTERLAARCETMIAMDAAPTAVDVARRRCAHLPHVEISWGEVPVIWPAGRFDLIVLSELGYYFTASALEGLGARAVASLEPGGDLVAVHWRGHSEDHRLPGDEVHRILGSAAGTEPISKHVEDDFRLEVWRR